MEKNATKKHDYVAIAIFLIILFLDNKASALSPDYPFYLIISLLVIYTVGLPLSFSLAKSHIISAQYFWRWANFIALLFMLLILKGMSKS